MNVPDAHIGVVMSHGVMSHGGWFARFSAALARHQVSSVAIDRRGSGLAKGRPGQNDPEAWVEDLVAAMDDMQTRVSRVVLLGWCWGARSAVVAATRRPPAHLVLMAPGLALTPMVKRRVDEIRARSEDPASLPFEIEAFSDDPDVLGWIRADALAWRTQPREFIPASTRIQSDAIAALARVRSPVTTFLAEGDLIVDNGAVAALVPGRVETLPGGHALILESPDAVAARVVEAIRL